MRVQSTASIESPADSETASVSVNHRPPITTVIIPTFNEAGNLRTLVTDVLRLGTEYSVIVVDDASPDGTGDIADQLSAAFPERVSVIHRSHKQGIGPAYLAGFKRALSTDADVIATMDGDGSHAPPDLAKLIENTESADLVLGSRYVAGGTTKGWPAHRRLLSRLGGRYAKAILGVPVHDLTGGFKAYRRSSLEQIDLDGIQSDGYVFQIETTYRVLQRGLTVDEIPIAFVDRVSGSSKLSRTIVIEAILIVWKLRLERVFSRLGFGRRLLSRNRQR